MDQRVLFHAPPPPHRTSGAGRTPADGRAHSTCRYTYQSIANCETPAVRRCAAVAASAWVRAWECATQNCLNSDIYANFDRDCRCGFSFITEGTLGLSGEIHNDKRLLGGSEVGGEDKNEQKALQRGATGPLEQTAPRFVSVFVTLPWEGGCSFAMGRSSLRLSPLLAHGHTSTGDHRGAIVSPDDGDSFQLSWGRSLIDNNAYFLGANSTCDGRRPAIRTGLLPSVCNDADRIQIGLWPYRGRSEAVATALGDETRVIAREGQMINMHPTHRPHASRHGRLV